MNRIIVLTGISGVGKDYLVHHADRPPELMVVGWGDELASLLGVDKDEMDTVDAEKMHRAQVQVCDKVIAASPVVAICHTVRPTSKGDLGYVLDIEARLMPQYYVFAVAPPAVIKARIVARNEAGCRNVSVPPVDEVANGQLRQHDLVKELADRLGSRFVTLTNSGENSIESLKKLSAIMNKLLRE